MTSYTSIAKSVAKKDFKKEISREEAEEAVKTLLKWAGEDPNREGLKETPKRVVNAYSEHFAGYKLICVYFQNALGVRSALSRLSKMCDNRQHRRNF